MPTYEYVCETCGLEFEKFQSMKDNALTKCPEDVCQQAEKGKGDVKRAIGTGAGLIFKGSGFYETDYRSEGYKSAAKKESDSGSSGESKGSTGETKKSESGSSDSKSSTASTSNSSGKSDGGPKKTS